MANQSQLGRLPVTALRHNLMWTRSGVVWGVWRLRGLSYTFAPKEQQRLARLSHELLLQGLEGEALLLGLCANEDPSAVADRMLAGVQIADHPEWAEEVMLTLDALTEVPVGERAFWLCVPLAQTGVWDRLRGSMSAAGNGLREQLSLPRTLPSEGEVERLLVQAKQIADQIPGAFQPQPATAAELVWIGWHSQHRGLSLDAGIPASAEDASEVFTAPTVFPTPLLDEGGQTDLDPKSLARINPLRRRYLKVESPYADAPSYQVMMALTKGPKGGWRVPDLPWLAKLDDFEFPIDWALRMQITKGTEVTRKNKRAEHKLRDQLDQQDTDVPQIVDTGSQLDEVAQQLALYQASLGRSEREVEVQVTTIVAVGADTAEYAQAQARTLAQTYHGSEFVFEPVLGAQETLWWAMQPGPSTDRTTREFMQITTAHELSSTVPLCASELGDDSGIRFAENISNGRHGSVFIDFERTIERDKSASIGVVAELGAGKSHTLKFISGAILDRGGRVFIVDRTEAREYATFAASLIPEQTAVVDIINPQVSLDPLRLFGPRIGARHVQSLFATMLGVRPRDDLGIYLSELLSSEHLAENSIGSLGQLRRHLQRVHSTENPSRLLSLINVIADKDLGRVLFDEALAPLDLAARAIIPLTAGLGLPSKEELDNAHLFEELSLEKIFGRSIYTLLTAIGKETCFRDPSTFGLAVFDEAHHITSSPDGLGTVSDFIRDGRKHRAAVCLASHDPADFGDEKMRGLLPLRLVMRQTDPSLATRALDWLHKGYGADDTLLAELTENTSPFVGAEVPKDRRGEAFYRDSHTRIGKIRVLSPKRAERVRAISSTPSTVTQEA